ncbi:MAG TPA: DUF2249 domain-containing protein [Accumulibacter sp.]|nr:DUF2249 domain-containing protein [Accumulibacter sp.]HMW17766.1 DUF2249 domain-containing protein [Accumulibacter sp.]HMX22526.1 DUF2249 domain-containing protein [Accumulibacter sp.]HMY05645.1 DUF2249 domain-containing protein [Accumulibacter sp.]HNC17902.1 DUF2249 domain-containing protein [Accumulibacter sp.]
MSTADADVVIDARGLEPPEPMVRTLEALERLAVGQTVSVLLPREPYPLYRTLQINGFAWETRFRDDGAVEVLIKHQSS